LLAAAGLAVLPAWAEAWQPDRPVRIVVANPAGAPLDVVARIVGEQLQARWHQPVIVDNRPGASGIIASDAVAKSKPDGLTLLMTATYTEAILPYAAGKLPYDFERDLTAVSVVVQTPFLLLVPAASRIKTFKDLGSVGAAPLMAGGLSLGSVPHVTWERIARAASLKGQYVPYQTVGQVQSDLLGGQLTVAVDTIATARGFIDNGKLRALAISSRERAPQLPEVPTLAQAGLPGFEAEGWIGLVAPSRTPPDRIAAVRSAVAEALAGPPARAKLVELGFTPVGNTPAEMSETVRVDRARYAPLVKELGISLR
jgi:tripartite-type tricarboxylate transporter receptor subunit TctC